jgi:hypothetical protein
MKKGCWKEKRYTLKGVVVENFYGNHKYGAVVEIQTDEEGLKKIKENPLQDYINYRPESIDYVYFDVYLTEIIRSLKVIVEKKFVFPVEKIEAGKGTETIEKIISRLYEDYPLPVKILYGVKLDND